VTGAATDQKWKSFYRWVQVTNIGRVVELVIDGDICRIKASGGHGSHAFHSDLIIVSKAAKVEGLATKIYL